MMHPCNQPAYIARCSEHIQYCDRARIGSHLSRSWHAPKQLDPFEWCWPGQQVDPEGRTGQPGRAVPFSPVFAVCNDYVLSCGRRFHIHSLSLQCCDVLHVHETNYGCL